MPFTIPMPCIIFYNLILAEDKLEKCMKRINRTVFNDKKQ